MSMIEPIPRNNYFTIIHILLHPESKVIKKTKNIFRTLFLCIITNTDMYQCKIQKLINSNLRFYENNKNKKSSWKLIIIQ